MTPGPELHIGAVGPTLAVGIGAMVVLLAEVLLSGRESFAGRRLTDAFLGSMLALASAVFLVLALVASTQAFVMGGGEVFNPDNPMLRLDRLASFSISLIAIGSLLACLLSVGYLAELRINHGEYYALLLLATSGMMLLVSATDMILLFLGLEIMSIPIYVLAGFDRRKVRSNESALKYFLVGSFASALLLYGMALLYGATGHTDFAGIRAGFEGDDPLAMIGLALVLVGFTFKISAVPFHQWTPDVYEGAPTTVTAYMAVTVKVAAFVALLRLVAEAFGGTETGVTQVLWVLAALTMIVGNVMAVVQDNVKRMLAYSSIAHAGYVLVGFVAASPDSYTAVLFYLLVYVFMTLGAFAVMVALAQNGEDCDRIEDFAGLARSRPGMAALMTLFMLALAGIPGTGGFIGKLLIVMSAVREGEIVLPILLVLTSVVSVYYYLRLPVMMYMQDPGADAPRRELGSLEGLVLMVCAVAVVILGLFPNDAPTALFSWIHALDWTREIAGTVLTD